MKTIDEYKTVNQIFNILSKINGTCESGDSVRKIIDNNNYIIIIAMPRCYIQYVFIVFTLN